MKRPVCQPDASEALQAEAGPETQEGSDAEQLTEAIFRPCFYRMSPEPLYLIFEGGSI